jgi:cytochrome c oxidase assembly protein subunit 15
MAAAASLDGVGTFSNPWPHRLAVVTAVATFFLILAGGVVTSTGAGMAVPDWPTTFGYNMFLYPWSRMVGGVLYEHAHRLLGSLVGSLTLTLAILLWAVEPRRWIRGLGIAALAAVVIQGVLGGLRVVLAQDALAIVHGGFAHAFFALVAGIALFTSRSWQAPVSAITSAQGRRLRHLALCTAVGVYVQVLLGTLVTHLGARLDAHLFVAALLSAAVIVLGFRIMPGRAQWPELVWPTEALRALWALQLLLGLGAYVIKFHAAELPVGAALGLAFPVSHRLTGSLMLIASVILALRAYRRTGWCDAGACRESLSPKVPA